MRFDDEGNDVCRCQKCGDYNSYVTGSKTIHEMRTRYKRCRTCGARWVTVEIRKEQYVALMKAAEGGGKACS